MWYDMLFIPCFIFYPCDFLHLECPFSNVSLLKLRDLSWPVASPPRVEAAWYAQRSLAWLQLLSIGLPWGRMDWVLWPHTLNSPHCQLTLTLTLCPIWNTEISVCFIRPTSYLASQLSPRLSSYALVLPSVIGLSGTGSYLILGNIDHSRHSLPPITELGSLFHDNRPSWGHLSSFLHNADSSVPVAVNTLTATSCYAVVSQTLKARMALCFY